MKIMNHYEEKGNDYYLVDTDWSQNRNEPEMIWIKRDKKGITVFFNSNVGFTEERQTELLELEKKIRI